MSTAVLLSGGMDSAALACWKRPAIAFTVDYGQLPAEAEIRAASQISLELGIKHEVIQVNCRPLGSGDLAGMPANPLAPASEWWPFRNQLLLTLCAMRAVAVGVTELLVASVKSDSLHADGRSEFFARIDSLLTVQEGHLRIVAPAITMTSAELIRTSGIDLGILAWAHSCHVSNYSCGQCRGCNKHREVTAELGYEPY